MKHEKRILAVVPARGGSKGIKLKNLLTLHNKTLIEYAADVIRQCDFIDKAVVSTDHELIKQEALRVGLEVPFMRPEHLSGDCISDIEVLRHALLSSEEIFCETFDIIVMLQPTSPFRSRENILRCVEAVLDGNHDSCITVSKTHYTMHPLKQLSVIDGKLAYYNAEGEKIISRHLVAPVYHLNGVCYALTRQCILDNGRILTENSIPLIVKDFTVDIDDPDDVRVAEYHLGILQQDGMS